MLLVIFGAGASYDSVPSRPASSSAYSNLEHRLPLAVDLFADRTLFVDAMTKFPIFTPLVPLLRKPPAGLSVEGLLQRFQGEAEHYPVRLQQLVAIRFYLHFVIWECQRHWAEVARGITNYETLLDQIALWRGRGGYERACLVTFNYDTLLEEALRVVSISIGDMKHYIENDVYKIIKVHGSMNWARDVKAPIADLQAKSAWSVGRELVELAATGLDVSDNYRIVREHPIGLHVDDKGQRTPILPALAIPVEAKREFSCPEEHVEVLKACIPEVTKILVVGWRGVEAHMIELLRLLKVTGRRRNGVVVAGSTPAADEVVRGLEHLPGVTWRSFAGGFTEFITSNELVEFLSK